MQGQPIQLPVRGVSDALPHIQQPGDLAGPEAMRNVRLNAYGKATATMGPREGLKQAFPGLGSGGRIQALFNVSSASSQVVTAGEQTSMVADNSGTATGYTQDSGAIRGQAWVIDTDNSLEIAYDEQATNAVGYDANACAWHPDGTKICVCVIFRETLSGGVSRVRTRVTMFDITTQTVVWAQTLSCNPPAGGSNPDQDLYVNSVIVTNNWVLVAAGPYVHVFATSTGTYTTLCTFDNWLWEITDITVVARIIGNTVISSDAFAVVGIGNPSVSGSVTTSQYSRGAYQRAAIVPFTIASNGSFTIDSRWNRPDYSGNPVLEDNYTRGHIRMKNLLPLGGRGVLPQGIVCDKDSRLVVCHTNTGFGASSNATGTFGYRTITKTQRLIYRPDVGDTDSQTDFAMYWSVDTNSRRDLWDGTNFRNDIPYDGNLNWIPGLEDAFGINCICVDYNGDIYAAGRPNTAGQNVFKIRGTDGSLIWSTNVGELVYQNGIQYDFVSQLVVVAGRQNTSWTGSNGRSAMLWKLNPINGVIVSHFSLEVPVTAYNMKVHPTTGKIVLATSWSTT